MASLGSNQTLVDFDDKSHYNLYQNSFPFARLSTFTIGIAIYYLVLFLVGFIGNVWVISVLLHIMRNLRLTSNQNVFIYILCLSGVDLLVVMLLPILISDVIMSRWWFGDAFCKIYIIIESVNKMLSTFILAMLSFDRYLAVCRPHESRVIRKPKITLVITILLLLTVIFLLTPVYFYAQEVNVDEFVSDRNSTIKIIGVPKCILNLSSEFIGIFSVYIFAVGFCLPSLLIVCFYATILIFIYKHAKSIRGRRSQIPVKRLTCATLFIVLFYFCCWTPYWIVTVLCVLISEINNFPLETKLLVLIHSLVYVNSAFNWVFYAYLNNNLRESRELASGQRRRSKISISLQKSLGGKSENNNNEPEVYL